VAVACSGPEKRVGKKVGVLKTSQQKLLLTDGKHRKKRCSSPDCTPGSVVVENNSLVDIAQAQSEGKTLERKAGEYVEAENERYKKANCGGMSAETCSVKMYNERREALKDAAAFVVDFVPVAGDIKSFAEAQSALDYLAAVIGVIPGAGDAAGKAIKAAETALKKGDIVEASRLINEGSQQIQQKLKIPKFRQKIRKKNLYLMLMDIGTNIYRSFLSSITQSNTLKRRIALLIIPHCEHYLK